MSTDQSPYAAERAAATEGDGLQPFLRAIRATHYLRNPMRPNEVTAYKPGPQSMLSCVLLAPDSRTPRWRVLRGYGWSVTGELPEHVMEVPGV